MTDQKNRRPTVLLAVLVVFGGLGVLLVLGTPLLLVAIQAAREAARREQAENNLAQIRLALEHYHSQTPTLLPNEQVEITQPRSAGEGPKVSLDVSAGGLESEEKAAEVVNQRLRQQVDERGLSRIWGDLEKTVYPSIRMRTQRADDQHIEIGVSKIGGAPDLPEGTEWPLWKGVPLAFIAQLKMADAAKHDLTGTLPQSGLLSFFYDARQETWGFDPKDRGSWQVLLFEDAPTALRRAEPPEGLSEHGLFTACTLAFSTELTLPPWESIGMDGLNLSDKEADRYIELLESTSAEGGVKHRLLGHPDPIQGDMQLECQLTFHGLYTGNSAGYEAPRREELEKGATDWQLLLQIDSDEENAGMMWGDGGRLYFWIRKDDLKKQAFENVWMVLQCY